MAGERDEIERALGGDLVRPHAPAGVAVPDEKITALAIDAISGDARAREALIDAMLPLVGAYARRFPTEGLDQADLIQEGIVGLLRALQRYEPAHGVPFAAYATWWIRRSLQDARSDFIRPFRLPPKALQQLSQLKSEHQRIYRAEGRSPRVEELAGRTEIDVDQARALLQADANVRSLDETIVGRERELGPLGDLLVDPLSASIYEDVIDSVAAGQLVALLSRLTERERDVVRARFGFDGHSEKLVDVGERLGVSAERVHQIEERALAKLRHGS